MTTILGTFLSLTGASFGTWVQSLFSQSLVYDCDTIERRKDNYSKAYI